MYVLITVDYIYIILLNTDIISIKYILNTILYHYYNTSYVNNNNFGFHLLLTSYNYIMFLFFWLQCVHYLNELF